MPLKTGDYIRDLFFSALRPQPHDLTVSAWADQNRILSNKSSAEPGRFRSSRTPYAVEPMACLSAGSNVRTVILMWGAQLAKTETGNNFIGYVIDYVPAPMLVVQPNIGTAKRFSKQRIEPMLRESPSLAIKVPPARKRDAGNTVLEKEFPSGILLIAGAESASGLRSMPIRFLFLDEIDAYPSDVEKEGDPVNLARARTRTFRNHKILMTSTPTFRGHSRIETEYDLSDQRRYHVPCPHCGHEQILRFEQLKWEEGKPETAAYECESCQVLIEERFKTQMLEAGRWIALYPDRESRGYHLNALYSPIGFYAWADIVRLFLESKDKPEMLRTFVNTVLAQTWEEKGESPDFEKLYRRRETYKTGFCPKEVLLLTAGADVQKNRIEVKIEGWGRDFNRYAIDYITLQGDPNEQDVWHQLDKVLEREFEHEFGTTLKIHKLAIDTGGHHTQMVYKWVRMQDVYRVMGIKGQDNMPMILGRPTSVDMVLNGVKTYRALQIWNIGVSHIKSELFSFLKKDLPLEKGDPLPYGWVHFPEWDQDWFKGLCSEKLIFENGKRRWLKTYERNEPLDTTVYARAAAAAVGIDSWGDDEWDILEANIQDKACGITRDADKPSSQSWINKNRERWI